LLRNHPTPTISVNPLAIERWPGPVLRFWAAVLLILLAPLVREGNRYLALIALKWVALRVLLAVLTGAL
jgi:hypothetical protein